MPQAHFRIVSPEPAFDRLPVIIRQKSSNSSAILQSLILIPAIGLLMAPFGLVAAHAAQDATMLTAILNKPFAAVQVTLGLLLWSAILLFPIKNIITRLGRERLIRIQAGKVIVTEQYLIFCKRWTAPLTSFRGIAHNVRTTHSGSCHELILIHSDRRKSLLLHTNDMMPQTIIERACQLLSVPQLPSKELYFSFSRRFGTQMTRVSTANA